MSPGCSVSFLKLSFFPHSTNTIQHLCLQASESCIYQSKIIIKGGHRIHCIMEALCHYWHCHLLAGVCTIWIITQVVFSELQQTAFYCHVVLWCHILPLFPLGHFKWFSQPKYASSNYVETAWIQIKSDHPLDLVLKVSISHRHGNKCFLFKLEPHSLLPLHV